MCLTEPGGFMEWDERDQMSSRVSPGPGGETKAMERLVGLALNFAKGNSENTAAYFPFPPLPLSPNSSFHPDGLVLSTKHLKHAV
jgi:hypothetical protein